MKRSFIIIVVFIITCVFLGACVPIPVVPEEQTPEEYCKEQYDELLASGEPPIKNFVGICIAVIESGNVRPYAAWCGEEAVLDLYGFTSRNECIHALNEYIKSQP